MSVTCTLHVCKGASPCITEIVNIELPIKDPALPLLTKYVKLDKWQSLMAVCYDTRSTELPELDTNLVVNRCLNLYERAKHEEDIQAKLREHIKRGNVIDKVQEFLHNATLVHVEGMLYHFIQHMAKNRDGGTWHLYLHEVYVTVPKKTPDRSGVHGQLHELRTLLACLNETRQHDNAIRTRKVPSSQSSSLDRTTAQAYASKLI